MRPKNPEASQFIELGGCQHWDSSSQGGTSRAIFSAFCDAIQSEEDPLTGGVPQLVGVYRIGAGQAFGIVQDGRPFLFGIPLDPKFASTSVREWRNTAFERCDVAGTLLPEAQKHHTPKGLGTSALLVANR